MRPRVTAALAVMALFLQAIPSAGAKDAKKEKDPTEIGNRDVSKGLNFYTLDQERALGKELAVEVEKQAKVVDDPIVSEYINRLGQNLARNSDVAFPLTFRLIEGDGINAFTLPGGYIFINTGLFLISGNEAELAAAIAHEIGHAAARHATRQASRKRLVNIGAIPLMVLGGPGGFLAGQLAVPMAFLQFSRAFETEADLLGVEYLWKSGYDPTANIDLFETLESTEKRQPGSVSKLFRTHPLTPDRIEKTQKNIDRLLPSREAYVINTSEYEDVRSRLEAVLPRPANQDSRNGTAPGPPTLKRK